MTLRLFFTSFFLLLLVLCAGRADAQTIYKCTLDGKISYGEAPCAAGHSVVLPAPPIPAAAASTAAFDSDQRLRQQAEQLSKERHRREAREEQAQQQASKEAGRRRQKCASLKLHQQWAIEDAERAVRDKHAGKAALRARRAGEKLAVECPQ